MKWLYFICCILFAGCTFTTTKTVQPKFREGEESVQPRVKALLACEYIAVNGTQTTVNGKTGRKLDITIINPVKLPQNNDDLVKLARSIAREIKDQLVNRGEFDTFNIFFIKQADKGNVKSETYKAVTLEYNEL